MIRRLPSRLFTTALLLTAAVGCSSSDSGGSSSASSGTATPSACAQDTRKDVYTAGLSRATVAGAYSVKIVDATPAPPAKLNNAMTFQLLDVAGAPVDNATIVAVPFMPDHGHGSAIKPTVTPKGGGMYDVTNLYYPMPGLWRVTLTVTAGSAAAQDVAFSFCIDG
jgi:hypothetical protein